MLGKDPGDLDFSAFSKLTIVITEPLQTVTIVTKAVVARRNLLNVHLEAFTFTALDGKLKIFFVYATLHLLDLFVQVRDLLF